MRVLKPADHRHQDRLLGPVRRVDVTRTPYCFVSLGGIQLDPGIRAPEGEVRRQQDLTMQSSYQVHWYVDPILYWLEVVLDHPCMETGSLDVAYITEVDPLWNDDELTMLLNPRPSCSATPLPRPRARAIACWPPPASARTCSIGAPAATAACTPSMAMCRPMSPTFKPARSWCSA
ncbi:protein of unknown function (plasmid) [Denitratisoma oestradiolicum]|uniref:Uncharacterized protein n=1 Tax=Denitratisoma oestradiolicum TaxID=311182 RepID=A0A6S6Y6N6_9PROT|nr:protein of unknown function [Denitratisoma oestradiolicum]